MTDLAGKYEVVFSALAADDNYLYFAWQEDVEASGLWTSSNNPLNLWTGSEVLLNEEN